MRYTTLLLVAAGAAIAGIATAVSADTIVIDRLLVTTGADWYRSAGAIDPVEHAIVMGTWAPPKAGDEFRSPLGQHQWREAKADENGWILHDDIPDGYAYASVEVADERVMILEAFGHRMVYVNGLPRPGNLYGYKDTYESWEPHFDYSLLPVRLHAGRNHLLFLGGRVDRIKARLIEPKAVAFLNTRDLTIPDLIVGQEVNTWAGVVIVNATLEPLERPFITASVGGKRGTRKIHGIIPPLTIRKVPVRLFGDAPEATGEVEVKLALGYGRKAKIVDEATITLAARERHENQRRTFISRIDGSVQYFGFNPAQDLDPGRRAALFLSVHGAGVEAVNQSGAYRGKTWGHIVAPTNRRPYGFNWEDWGRLDAMETLDRVEKALDVDPDRIYLTGHSMGGHGTWHLGALYPDRFAALGPSAGWISFWSYRPSREVAMETPLDEMLMRATLPSHTLDLAPNYASLGIYILHGADDDNVRAEQSHIIVERLEELGHRDFVYHEEPDAGHWWDKNDEAGADCVDWPPMFDFFAQHARPGRDRVREVSFRTPGPGVSATHHWLTIEAQHRQYKMSSAELRVDPEKRRFVGTTENIARMTLRTSMLEAGEDVTLHLDGQELSIADPGVLTLVHDGTSWRGGETAPPSAKGPLRSGAFKSVFNHDVLFVMGTTGTPEETAWAMAKARFDAEQFWYQGNGSIEIVPDTNFDASRHPDRSIILYGHRGSNAAWDALLENCPVAIERGRVIVGERTMEGDDIGVLFVYPRAGSDDASVGVVAGTGLSGMRLTNARPYLNPGFAYPDLTLMRAGTRADDGGIVVGAGFFGNDWSVESGEFAWE